MAEKMMITLAERADTQSSCHESIVRVSSKAKAVEELSIHYCADQDTITTVFRTITSGESAQSLRGELRTTAVTEPEHARAPVTEDWIKNITTAFLKSVLRRM